MKQRGRRVAGQSGKMDRDVAALEPMFPTAAEKGESRDAKKSAVRRRRCDGPPTHSAPEQRQQKDDRQGNAEHPQ
jgi:hypothetical protein